MSDDTFAVGEVHDVSLAGLLRRSASIFGPEPAVVWPSGSLSYQELNDEANRFAHSLTALGVDRGDRLAVVSENRVEYIVAYLGAAKIGVTVVGLNIRWHPEEALTSLADTDPSALLLSRTYEPLLQELRGVLPEDLHIIHLDSTGSVHGSEPGPRDEDYRAMLDRADPAEPPILALGSDIHNILYTSGTTGYPKGAMISQRAAALRALGIAQWFGLTREDGYVGWLPLYHVAGDESLYATLLSGGRYAVLPSSDPEVMYQMIERHRLTWTILVPGTVTAFARHPARPQYDLQSLRFAAGYGDLLTEDVLREFSDTVGIPYYDAYGQTETSYLVAWYNTPPGALPTLRKCPVPLLTLRIVDETMHDVARGEVGELVARGPTLMSGYWRKPDATRAVFQGGWLHTGDLMRWNEDGTLSFADRVKALIKTGGENVYPAEVERVLATLPGVSEVCVVGVPDPEWGERVHAVIVLEPHAVLTRDAVDAACLKHLARYKRPRGVTFLTSTPLPRSTTGKIQRDAVRDVVMGKGERLHG